MVTLEKEAKYDALSDFKTTFKQNVSKLTIVLKKTEM